MTWRDITFKQYLDLLYFYQNIEDYGDDMDKMIGLICIFNEDLDIDSMYEKPFIEVNNMATPIVECIQQPMEFDSLKHIELETLTYGDWINAEIHLKNKDYDEVFAILYPKCGISVNTHSPVEILKAYEAIIEYRAAIYKNYSNIFKFGGQDEVDPDETPEEREERLAIEKDTADNSEWTWYLHTYDLAKGDITKFDEIFNQNHLFVFNILDMKKRFKLNEVYRGLF